jgi:hypothetical protein
LSFTFAPGGHFIWQKMTPRRDALSESLVPCYAADLVALSKVSRDGKDELQCLGHIMRQKRSSKITPMAFSSQSLASYLAENGHDIRQLTLLPFFTSRRYTTFAITSLIILNSPLLLS